MSSLKDTPIDKKKGTASCGNNHSDAIFSITLKAYTMLSARRNNCDIEDAFEQVPVLLKDIIETSACALKEVETDFAFDSTGFSTAYNHGTP